MIRFWHTWRVSILSTLGLLVVIGVAVATGSMSWQHIVHVGRTVQEPSSGLLPIAVDGMMVTGALMAWVDRIRGYRPRFWSLVALWFGSMLTVTFNILSAKERGWAAMAVAAVPAAAFLVTVEAVFHPSTRLLEIAVEAVARAASTPPVAGPVSPVQAPVTPPEPVPASESADVPTDVTAGPEPAPEPEPERPKRRRARIAGHPGTGASGPVIEAAVVDLRERARAIEPVFMGPAVVDAEIMPE